MDALKTVLVVEDNADDAELLRLAAQKGGRGLAFHFVPDGEQAIAYLKGEGQFADRRAHPFPELVLLDLWLPGKDGFEVLAWVRQHPELKGLKVFVWTDAGQPQILDRATRAGADRFVPKSLVFVRGGLAGLMGGILQALMGSSKESSLVTRKP